MLEVRDVGAAGAVGLHTRLPDMGGRAPGANCGVRRWPERFLGLSRDVLVEERSALELENAAVGGVEVAVRRPRRTV